MKTKAANGARSAATARRKARGPGRAAGAGRSADAKAAAGAKEGETHPDSGSSAVDRAAAEKMVASLRRKMSHGTSILTDDEVAVVATLVREMIQKTMGEESLGMFADVASADFVRWASLKHSCEQARKTRGLTIRDAALELKIAQKRLRAIEEGDWLDFEPETAWRYFDFLGIAAWVKRWTAANRQCAQRAGLTPRSSAGEGSAGKGAPQGAGSRGAKAVRAAGRASRLPARDVV